MLATQKTRMHSSRMRTACSSSRLLGVSASVHAGIHPPAWPGPGPGPGPRPGHSPPTDAGLETPRPDPPNFRMGCNPFLMRTESPASSHSCRSVDADAQYKRALTVGLFIEWRDAEDLRDILTVLWWWGGQSANLFISDLFITPTFYLVIFFLQKLH